MAPTQTSLKQACAAIIEAGAKVRDLFAEITERRPFDARVCAVDAASLAADATMQLTRFASHGSFLHHEMMPADVVGDLVEATINAIALQLAAVKGASPERRVALAALRDTLADFLDGEAANG